MKAIVFEEFGGPEVLRPTEVELPRPGPGQVRLRVVAARAQADSEAGRLAGKIVLRP
ncbi:hypothetical protein [Streptomyces sp. NPDC051567]|uniref:hypothetical protein n=1 Tax=Streptomyces sp. NPDC051567 TaxID=3365660 RepID=UPI0037BA0946